MISQKQVEGLVKALGSYGFLSVGAAAVDIRFTNKVVFENYDVAHYIDKYTNESEELVGLKALKSGYYWVAFSVGADSNIGNRQNPKCTLRKNGEKIHYTASRDYTRNTATSDKATLVWSGLVFLESSDYIDLYVEVESADSSGIVETIPAECTLSMTYKGN